MENLEQRIAKALMEDALQYEIRNAGVYRFMASYRFEKHNHREIEIIYIKSGHCIVGVHEDFAPLREGDLMILHRGIPHCFFVDKKESCQIAQLEFDMTVPEYLSRSLAFFGKGKTQKLSNCERAGELIESIGRLHRLSGKSGSDRIQMKLTIFQLLIELSARIEEKSRIEGNGRIDAVISYINEHYEDDLNVEDLADRFGISSRYLRKCFKKEAGINCSQYIISLRIEKAKELLWLSGKSVTEIASLTGFNSSQYFSRVFQQYTGRTPAEYRNHWKGSRAEERCVVDVVQAETGCQDCIRIGRSRNQFQQEVNTDDKQRKFSVHDAKDGL